MKTIKSVQEGTKEQLEEFISLYLRTTSPKTGKQIKINTAKWSKQDLVNLVKKYEKHFLEFVNGDNGKDVNSFSQSQLIKVGTEIASMYGGRCLGYKIRGNKVYFQCIEHGEKFETSLNYDEISEYL